MDRKTYSEYERGWWDCFDKINSIIESAKEPDYDFIRHSILIQLDSLEKEFNESCGGCRGERAGEPN